MTRTVIDPVTRVGGHLRIEIEAANGLVTDAWSSGTMFRGIERILHGRDPRDAWLFAQRICGACTGVHALASVRAVEQAFGLRIPTNARLVRNLMAGTGFVEDHVVQFYHQHALDWVDVEAALTADPAAASAYARSLSDWPDSSVAYYKTVKQRLAGHAASGQLGPFAGGAWGSPAYRLPPEVDLVVLAHYLAALDWQRQVSRIHTYLGGKNPHPQTYLVGGMALTPPWGGPARTLPGQHPNELERDAPAALSSRGLADIAKLIGEAKTFVEQVYLPDVLAVAGYYRDDAATGIGVGDFLSYGEFPEDDTTDPPLVLPRGRIVDRDLTAVLPVDQAEVAESTAHAHYAAEDGALRHPFEERTEPRYAGPALPYATLEGVERYSWIKAPRYQGRPAEVGPLARVLVGYAEGRRDVRTAVDAAASRLGIAPEGLFGTVGRTVARAIEAKLVAGRLVGWHEDLKTSLAGGDLAFVDLAAWDPGAWPADARGWSLGESPRGALGHWVSLKGQAIDTYEVVDPSTWNGSPRDATGRRGPWEEALVGTPIAEPERPVEVLRTIHSFAPCTACAAHLFGAGAGGSIDIRVGRGRRVT
jgi:hydrogenase large subunit